MSTHLPLPEVTEITIAELIDYCQSHYPRFAQLLLNLQSEPLLGMER